MRIKKREGEKEWSSQKECQKEAGPAAERPEPDCEERPSNTGIAASPLSTEMVGARERAEASGH